MFCPNCGSKNPDNAVFCEHCGTKLNNSQPAETQNAASAPAPEVSLPDVPVAEAPIAEVPLADIPVAEAPVADTPVAFAPAPPVAAVRVKAPRSSNPVLNAVKNIGASPLFLIAAIAFSVALFFDFIGTVGGNYAGFGYLSYYFDRLGIDYSDDFFSLAYRYLTVLGVVFLIPNVFYTVGMWITFASASSRSNNGMSAAGLTMIKVMQIIALIFHCILWAVVGIVLIISIIAASTSHYSYDSRYYSSSGGLALILIFIAVVFLAAFVLSIIYRAKIISSLGAVKKTVNTGNPVYRVSGFVGVMNFIVAVSSLIVLVYKMVLLRYTLSAVTVFSTLCGITALVCFALVLFKYNNAMRRLTPRANYAQPYSGAYQQPQYPNGGYNRY